MFEGRLSARLQPYAPRVVETPEGHEVWEFDGNRYSQPGANAVAGRRPEKAVTADPTRFEEMRPGCWNIDARIRDMDINGVWASLNFPIHDHGVLRSGLLVRQGPGLWDWR